MNKRVVKKKQRPSINLRADSLRRLRRSTDPEHSDQDKEMIQVNRMRNEQD